MSKKIQLSIPEPCHENWDKMTPVEKGKFCGSCQKQVVDFSRMSDREIAQFFKTRPLSLSKGSGSKGGSVCGRFMTSQLEREIDIPKKRIPWLKYFFGIILPAFFLSKLSAQKTMGKVAPDPRRDTIPVSAEKELQVLGMVLPDYIKPVEKDTICAPVTGDKKKPDTTVSASIQTYRGTVIDRDGLPLPGASVILKGSNRGVATDNEGRFRIGARKGDVLAVSGAGLVTTEITMTDANDLCIVLSRFAKGQEMIVTAGMVVVKRRPSKKKEVVPLIPDARTANPQLFKVFPNPAPPGTELAIENTAAGEGYYRVQLLNQSGQSVFQKEIWIDAEAGVLQLDLPVLSAGTYFLTLADKKTGKSYTEKIIIT